MDPGRETPFRAPGCVRICPIVIPDSDGSTLTRTRAILLPFRSNQQENAHCIAPARRGGARAAASAGEA